MDDDDDRQDVEFGSDDEDNGEDGLGLAFGDDEGSEAGDDAAFDAGDAVGVAAGRGAGAAGCVRPRTAAALAPAFH